MIYSRMLASNRAASSRRQHVVCGGQAQRSVCIRPAVVVIVIAVVVGAAEPDTAPFIMGDRCCLCRSSCVWPLGADAVGETGN